MIDSIKNSERVEEIQERAAAVGGNWARDVAWLLLHIERLEKALHPLQTIAEPTARIILSCGRTFNVRFNKIYEPGRCTVQLIARTNDYSGDEHALSTFDGSLAREDATCALAQSLAQKYSSAVVAPKCGRRNRGEIYEALMASAMARVFAETGDDDDDEA